MAILYGIYALVLLVGGVMGYVKAQSLPSLIAGIVSGIVVVTAAVLLPSQPRTGLILGAVASAILDGVFSVRFARTRKPVPSLLLSIFSAGVLLASILQLVQSANKYSVH